MPSVSVWQYLLWLTHAPFLGWTMLHVIGFNSLDIFLYMILELTVAVVIPVQMCQ